MDSKWGPFSRGAGFEFEVKPEWLSGFYYFVGCEMHSQTSKGFPYPVFHATIYVTSKKNQILKIEDKFMLNPSPTNADYARGEKTGRISRPDQVNNPLVDWAVTNFEKIIKSPILTCDGRTFDEYLYLPSPTERIEELEKELSRLKFYFEKTAKHLVDSGATCWCGIEHWKQPKIRFG